MKKITLLLVFAGLFAASCQNPKYPDLADGVYAEFVTNKGTFVAKLFHEQAPVTVSNFVTLASGKSEMADSTYMGKPYYNGLIFHRVINDFMIQGGCPLGNGMGSPGYAFPDEFVQGLVHDKKGILSMANSGPNTNGSQFFITLKETPHLDYKHAVFGEIVIGQDIVDSIGAVETSKPGDKPVEDVVMQEVNILTKGDIVVPTLKEALTIKAEKAAARAEEIKNTAAEYKAKNEAILADAEELPSGLRRAYVTKGEGETPAEGQIVLLEYEGYYTDGLLFDTSDPDLAEKFDVMNLARKEAGRYGALEIPFSSDARMIPGFKEAMLSMQVGDEIMVYLPSHLGYGEQGSRAIPPNTDLIFRMKMTGIKQ